MHAPPTDTRSLARSGVEALRRGDARAARESFEQIVATGEADASACVGLAYACRSLKDNAASKAAVEKALALEPRNLRALILKADYFAEEGDARAASAFYLAAVRAAPPADQLPLDLRNEVGRAKAMCDRYAAQFEAFLISPYVQGESRRPHNEQEGMLNNRAWSAFYLWKDGAVVADHAVRCPRTMKALAEAPLTHVQGRSPAVLFSLLRPGTHIPPHNGFVNTRLICHLPLIVPGSCSLRVGNDTRDLVEGKAWLFDDTMEHEAWNDSDRTRVILLFEIWRPELTAEERRLVGAMFEAIDAHSGEKAAWEI